MGFFSSCEHEWKAITKSIGFAWMARDHDYHKCTKCGKEEECILEMHGSGSLYGSCKICGRTMVYG